MCDISMWGVSKIKSKDSGAMKHHKTFIEHHLVTAQNIVYKRLEISGLSNFCFGMVVESVNPSEPPLKMNEH